MSPESEWTNASCRHFLSASAFGLGGLALSWLLKQDGALGADQVPKKPLFETPSFDLLAKSPPLPARADAMISIFMGGGPSHLDMFDPKPQMGDRWQGWR